MERHPFLNITDVKRIAHQAAREQSPNLRVVGVTTGDGDGHYVEVIIDLEECSHDPCRVSVGVFRNTSRDEVRAKIIKHLQRHVRKHGR